MKKERNRQCISTNVSMPVVNPSAAGIDMGSRSLFVCGAQDNVKEFGVFTPDLHEIAKHLQSHGIKNRRT